MQPEQDIHGLKAPRVCEVLLGGLTKRCQHTLQNLCPRVVVRRSHPRQRERARERGGRREERGERQPALPLLANSSHLASSARLAKTPISAFTVHGI